jgi:hypothetical protein
VKGTGGGKFSPNLSITRQEITTMIYRALSKAYSKLPSINSNNFPFKDIDKIASWALDSMKFAYQNGIIKGVSPGQIDPLSDTTREQGIILIKRTYESFRTSINATLRLEPVPTPMSEADKLKNLDWSALLNAPAYDTKLSLYVATGESKPLYKPTGRLPVTTGSLYTKSDDGALIEASGNRQRYFYADYGTLNPYAIVWQVSRATFNGFSTNWKNPSGLVASGTIVPASKEFVIDFSKFTPLSIFNLGLSTKTSNQQIYYVRAVPVDKNMNCIGDPGEGIRVLYGDKLIGSPSLTQLVPLNGKKTYFPSTFALWTTYGDGDITCKEFPNTLEHLTEVGFNSLDSVKWFQFKNFNSNATEVVLQVSAKPFDNKNPVDNPSGLVYSKAYKSLPIPSQGCPNTENSVSVKFHDFAPADSILKQGDTIPYYVRAVAFVPSATPGSVDYSVSEVVKVNYFKQNTVTIYTLKSVSIPSYVPQVKIIDYQPIQWQDPNWAHYYVVYRYPQWNELNFEVTDGTNTLYPYIHYWMQDPTMTTDRYEKEILWKWLAPGSKIQVWDKQEDKSFWEDLWDGIVSFFKSLIDIIKSLVNWVSQAYASLKSGLINFVVSNLPGLPNSWREGLKKALTALVDYGLASIGIPPELPNFDQLASGSLDYFAEQALTQAGIPANEITTDMVTTTAKGIGDSLTASTNSSTPNPLNCPFLKADPKYLYRPAYIDIQITNPYDKPSIPGELNVDVKWDWHDSGFTITMSDWAQKPPDQQFADSLTYIGHFLYGLKKGYPYYPVYYSVFEPIRNVAIPILQPHQSTTVRVYLKEYLSKPYPFAPQGEAVTWDDFANLYNGMGGTEKSTFTVYANGFSLPVISPKTTYDASTHTITTYQYDYTESSDSFQEVPKNPH